MFQVERMDSAALPAATMPQLLTDRVPAGRFPENRLRHGRCREGRVSGAWCRRQHQVGLAGRTVSTPQLKFSAHRNTFTGRLVTLELPSTVAASLHTAGSVLPESKLCVCAKCCRGRMLRQRLCPQGVCGSSCSPCAARLTASAASPLLRGWCRTAQKSRLAAARCPARMPEGCW